jgi:phosphate starvation-inducible PhoH-like protein
LGKNGPAREIINKAVKLAPLCYMRGRTFNHSICILDEAQNATYQQFKLFLSRFGDNSQVVVTGDPQQSDLPFSPPPFVDVLNRLTDMDGIQMVAFDEADVVRHPLIGEILKRL